MDLESLSDYVLARLLIRKLWQMYDNGGVSMGRSLRASLLESILPLLPELTDEESGLSEKVGVWELYREGERRRKINKKVEKQKFTQPLLFVSLPYISNATLFCLVIDAILDWYKADEKKSDFPLVHQKDIVEMILYILSNCFYKKQFARRRKYGYEELIEEVGNRGRVKMEMDLRQRLGFW
jgi:hypothetical protein